eukprot:CAMPEP_0171456412 /NCGR_PEP_ID=MMETSP0945-20130129/2906_1 /TAXON_ID=109269 /ORGANISM="Vaucheria litorea, Strain CCMP2940" /LENGTH=204 /DNA_ID=CAMNT_0011981825 /DNA_START=116 /DNA_END=731 /DNA_ORIENTATION=-
MAVLLPSCIGVKAQRAWITGARWGFGHGLGASAFGVLAILVKKLLHFDLASASHWLELVLSGTLLAIGGNGLRESYFNVEVGRQSHIVEDAEDIELTNLTSDKSNSSDSVKNWHDSPTRTHTHDDSHNKSELSCMAAVSTGILHGFTGTGHLLGILPALTMPTASGASLYLFGFLTGTLVAMAGFTAVVGHLSVSLRGLLVKAH